MSFEFIQNARILLWGNNNCDVLRVLGGGTDHRRTTDVDLFDRLFSRDFFTFYRFRKRVKIYNHQIYRLNSVLLQCGDMVRVIANGEQTTMHARMQRFHAPVHHFRKTGDLRDVAHLEARVTQRLCGSTRADDLHVEAAELAGEIDNSVLVRNTEQCSSNWSKLKVVVVSHYGSVFLPAGRLIKNFCVRE